MKEEARQERNRQRLTECFGPFATVMRRVLDDMEGQGFRPRIQDAFRTEADQLKAFEAGTSAVKFGFHNITGAGGAKEALACDVLDDDHPLSPGHKYLLTLAIVAHRHGLQTLITQSLSKADRAKVAAAIAGGDPNADCPVGKDPTHCEPTGITIAQAKSGTRPTFADAPVAPPLPPPPARRAHRRRTTPPPPPPPPTGRGRGRRGGHHVHIVQQDENLSVIAKKHHTTVKHLLELNPEFKSHPALIHKGDKIKLD